MMDNHYLQKYYIVYIYFFALIVIKNKMDLLLYKREGYDASFY